MRGVTLLIAYELHEYPPDNKKRVIDLRVLQFVLKNAPHGDSCYSNAISKKISRTVIRVIREIRVLLNIEILIFFRLNIYKGGLYGYNDPSNNELSVFTGQQYFFIFHGEALCSLAPPHHFVVPSPYKQGESAIRTEIVRCPLLNKIRAKNITA